VPPPSTSSVAAFPPDNEEDAAIAGRIDRFYSRNGTTNHPFGTRGARKMKRGQNIRDFVPGSFRVSARVARQRLPLRKNTEGTFAFSRLKETSGCTLLGQSLAASVPRRLRSSVRNKETAFAISDAVLVRNTLRNQDQLPFETRQITDVRCVSPS